MRDTVSRVTGAPGRSFQQGAEENVHMFAEPCGRRKACGPNPVAPTPPHVRVLADWARNQAGRTGNRCDSGAVPPL
ncbi:hypothetical protein Scinn_73660 [Streptomyces virginiae]|uniref:Uncharacterized protein n=1 Tax=Streptomyces virginiae TaxID=1961 RepID=A0ABQ3NYQ1_STRVG|nr:hypothetical protein Scinn_73660 [Streptomyces virginiae]